MIFLTVFNSSFFNNITKTESGFLFALNESFFMLENHLS